jgi:hypothetical protein
MRGADNRWIYVTRRELYQLRDIRAAACKQCPDVQFQRAIRDRIVPFPYEVFTNIFGRDRDGSLIGEIRISGSAMPRDRVRSIRIVRVQGLTEDRDIRLRRNSNPRMMQRPTRNRRERSDHLSGRHAQTGEG